jgi:uncharacterized protein YbjQ (UPF0145 family)
VSTAPPSDERLPIYTSNTFEIPGLELEQHLGLCWGLIVVSLGFGRSFTGGSRSLAAGEVSEFTEEVDEARRGALFRMVEHAKGLGGNAVVGVRFDSNTLGESGVLAEFVAYGSAVMVKTG